MSFFRQRFLIDAMLPDSAVLQSLTAFNFLVYPKNMFCHLDNSEQFQKEINNLFIFTG